MKKTLKQFNKTAIVSVAVVLISIFLGLGINMVIAVTWQDPTAVAPNLGSLEPPLNTSLLAQQKTGGLYIATQGGGLRVASGAVGAEKFYVLGDSYISNNTSIIGNLNVVSSVDVSAVNAGDTLVGNGIVVNNGLIEVNDALDKVIINNALPLGLLTIQAGSNEGITVTSDFAGGNAIYVINQNLTDGGGLSGAGKNYGVYAKSTGPSGIAVLGDGTSLVSSPGGGLYAKGRDSVYGLIGRGLYGVVGLDNTEDVDNPVFVGSGNSVAGLFEGSVDIIPSAGGNSDLVIDGNNLVVRALTNKVGIGTDNPSTRLHIVGENNISSAYGAAGVNGTLSGFSTPILTVAGVYGESGTVAYAGAGTGWNFGVYGKADNPGNSKSVGIMGVESAIAGDTYAGWFDGNVEIDGKIATTSILDVTGTLTADLNIKGLSDFNLSGAGSDISLTGTDSGIFLTGQITTGSDIEYMGKLNMHGGLPVYGTEATTCNVAPAEYNEGTMYTCNWCPVPGGQRYFAIMVRMNKSWVNIGYGKSVVPVCFGDPYDPESPLLPQENGPGDGI